MSKESLSFNSYEETLEPSVIDEVRMWSRLLEVLFQGLPVPYNPAKMLVKIHEEELNNPDYDFSELKKCCFSVAEIREVKHLKPLIQDILNRIIALTRVSERTVKINNYE